MKIVLILIAAIVVLIVSVMAYYGAFTSAQVSEKETGPYWLVFEKHIGEYKGSAAVMDKIYNQLLNEDSIETTLGFGLYYDNPQQVEKEKLRCIAGCILQNADSAKVEQLKTKYQIRQFPSSKSVVSEFPFKGQMSVIFGIFKVYPQIKKYAEEKGFSMVPTFEIYDVPQKKINYIAAVRLSQDVFDSFLE